MKIKDKMFNYSENLFDVGVSVLIGIFSIFILSSIGFIFHISINIFYTIFAILSSLFSLLYLLQKRKANAANICFSFAALLLILFVSYLLAVNRVDTSWDGRAYHKLAIMLLGNGWNPIYDSIYSFSQKFFNNSVDHLIWIETYPKFMEVVAANVFSVTKQIEAGKLLNYLLMFVCFEYSFYILSKKRFLNIETPFKLLISLAIVFNPVVIAQMFTYYTDFSVYLFFMLIVFSIIDFLIEQNNKALFICLMSSICLLNIKWGGFLFYIITLIICLSYLLINKEKKFALKFCIVNIIVIISTALTLINPIYTNIKNNHHPLYPVAGKEKIDIMTSNTPKEFIGQNRFKNLFISYFSRVDNPLFSNPYSNNIKLKKPFLIYKTEIYNLSYADLRVCGFGVLWSGIIILTFVLSFFIKFKDKNDKKLFFLLIILLTLLTILNPYSWWARYAPHVWLFPILVSFCILNKNTKTKPEIIITYLLYSLIVLNLIIQTLSVAKNEWLYRRYLYKFIEDIHNLNYKTLEIYGTYDMAIIQKFNEKKIKYKFVDEEYYSENKDKFEIIPVSLGKTMQYKLEEK